MKRLKSGTLYIERERTCFVGYAEWRTLSSKVIIQKRGIVKPAIGLEPRQWEKTTKQKKVKTKHGDAISIEKIRWGTYFIENGKKKNYLYCAM